LKDLDFDEATYKALIETAVLKADNDKWQARGQVTLPNGKIRTVRIRQDGKVWSE